MSKKILGYKINDKALYVGEYTVVYTGLRNADNSPIVVKMLKEEHPSLDLIAHFKHEYEIAKLFNAVQDIVQVFSLEQDGNNYAIVMENINFSTLSEVIERKKKFNLEDFLNLAIPMAEGLGHVHKNNIIHMDINPNNIMCDYPAMKIKIIDFGLSDALPKERAQIVSPNALKGTLSYLSPEQTGRMNRGIDYRTDYYSLGVTFYQMLTGGLPFVTDDPMQLVHYHIAAIPKSPKAIDSSIPEVVSDVVMKLLAKNAEDRYQNVNGLIADLQECRNRLQCTGKIDPFSLGIHDLFNQFQIPEKLYGRENELNALLNTYERVVQGKAELLLVAGYSGIGKTALVHEIHKTILARHGYFISGKFDQFKKNIPYSAIVQAFDDFVQQILTESEEKIDKLRHKIMSAVQDSGQLILDLIPSFASIIGKQPEIPVLGPIENQNRLNFVFQNLIKAVASSENPLVIFLDDLQWADLASLKMIETLLLSPDCQYLFIIGAYRNNEVGVEHPLMQTLEKLKKREILCESIDVGPLTLEAVSELIADSLHQDLKSVQPLAGLCYEKTGGNPFFLIQLLLTLYKEQLIVFDLSINRWIWDFNKIKEIKISDNVVQLMVNKIGELAPDTQKALQLAAFLGNQFDLETLAAISAKDSTVILQELNEALREGYIISSGNASYATRFYFAHDRIQQAAYSMVEEDQRILIHTEIARLLLKKATTKKLEEKLFDIVNHYDLAIEQGIPDNIIDIKEKRNIAELNLKASQAASSAAAFELALKYVEYGLRCVQNESWKNDYALMFGLYSAATEVSYLNGKFDLFEKYAEISIENAATLIDKIKIMELKILAYSAQTKQEEAIKIGIEAIDSLGLKLPIHPTLINIFIAMAKLKFIMIGKSIASLENLPVLTNQKLALIIRLTNFIIPALVHTNHKLLMLITLEAAYLSLQHGLSGYSATIFLSYGIINVTVLNQINVGYEWGKLALKVVRKLGLPMNLYKITFVAIVMLKHWKEPVHDLLPLLKETAESSFHIGATEQAGYSIANYYRNAYITGVPINELLATIDSHKMRFKEIQPVSYNTLSQCHQVLINLSSQSLQPTLLIGSAFDAETMLPAFKKANNKTMLFLYYLDKLILCFLFEKYDEALANAQAAEQFKEGFAGGYPIQVFHFYRTLAYLHDPKKNRNIPREIRSSRKKMAQWAKLAPANALQKHLLIEAEIARMKDQHEIARKLYDQAIAAANKHKFLNDEALANELAAKYYLSQDNERLASMYMEDARYTYLLWGAQGKVAYMDQQYSHLFMRREGSSRRSTSSSISQSSIHSSKSNNLDISSIEKTSYTLSSTIVLGDLLKKLMIIAIENAGAERSYLLLNKDGKLFIEAEGMIGQDEPRVLQSIEINNNILPISIINYVNHANETVVLDDAFHSTKFAKDAYIQEKQPKSILCMPLLNKGQISGILYMENNLTKGVFSVDRIKFLNVLSSQMAISIDNARLYNRTKELCDELVVLNRSFARFVPEDFLRLLEKNSILDVKLGDHVQKNMTVLFADIRDFTTLSEKMTPEENFNFINSILNIMSPIIQKHHGFIDKFIGDAIMALFPEESDHAIQCALEMQESLVKYNQGRMENDSLKIGIGINTGPLMLGTVGEEQRMSATVISDAVNVAARVESLTKNYNVSILITKDTYDEIKNPAQYDLKVLDTILVKGKAQQITIYAVTLNQT